MILFLRVTAFLCTCFGLATFVSLNSRITILNEDKAELIHELEKKNPNEVLIAERKKWIKTIEEDFDPKESIIIGVSSIVLSFLISDLSKYLKRKKQNQTVLTIQEAARPES